MSKLNELLDMWRQDSIIDRTEPGREITNIPQLHSKYLTILSHNRLVLKEIEFKINRLRKLKWLYYTGEMSEEMLKQNGWEPFLGKIMKSDMNTFIDGDEDMGALVAKKAMVEQIIENCISIMKELHSRTFQIKALIEWERFIQGI